MKKWALKLVVTGCVLLVGSFSVVSPYAVQVDNNISPAMVEPEYPRI